MIIYACMQYIYDYIYTRLTLCHVRHNAQKKSIRTSLKTTIIQLKTSNCIFAYINTHVVCGISVKLFSAVCVN